MSSLMEAEKINAQGVYCVGCQDGDASALPAMEQLTPDKVIQLKMPAEDNVDRKIYSLNDLKDLQSKLMLIAAKASQGKEEVDRFLDVSFYSQYLKPRMHSRTKHMVDFHFFIVHLLVSSPQLIIFGEVF